MGTFDCQVIVHHLGTIIPGCMPHLGTTSSEAINMAFFYHLLSIDDTKIEVTRAELLRVTVQPV